MLNFVVRIIICSFILDAILSDNASMFEKTVLSFIFPLNGVSITFEALFFLRTKEIISHFNQVLKLSKDLGKLLS